MRIDTERFEVERVVGSGSMGTVFRARDRETGVPVALKIMRNDHPSRAARFDREVEVLAHLVHPSIVRYLGPHIWVEDQPGPLEAIEELLIDDGSWVRDLEIEGMHPVTMHPAGWWRRV